MIKKNCINPKVKAKSLTVLLVSVFLLFALAGIGKVSAAGYTEYTGILDDADFVARFPETWNGMLVIYCRSYSFGTISAVAALDGINSLSSGSVSELLNQGFAVAASSYGAAGYPIQKGMDTTYALTNYLVSTYHVTGKVFLWDVSMSGPVGLLLGEKYPNIYSGVLDIVGIKDLKDAYERGPALTRAELEAETGGTPTTQPKAYEDRSPIYHANIAIPVITVHGTSDVTVPFNQSVMYQTAVANAGHANLYRLYNVTGAYHLSTSIYSQVPARFAELVAWSNELTGSLTLTPAVQVPGASVAVEGVSFGATKAVGIGFGAEVNATNELMNVTGPYDVGTGPYIGYLSHLPIKPGSYSKAINISATSFVVIDTDNGNGTFTSINLSYFVNGTIDYVTGQVTLFVTAPFSSLTFYVSLANYTYYQYNVTPAAGVTTNSSGALSTSITVPSVANDLYTVTAVDTQGHIATATLSVDNTIPESLTIEVMVIVSSVAVIVGTRYFRKRPRPESCGLGKS